jgi:hypothetical protein
VPSATLTLAVLLNVSQRLCHRPRLQEGALRRRGTRPQLPARPSWGPEARHATIVAVHRATQVMDDPADLINVAIEERVDVWPACNG